MEQHTASDLFRGNSLVKTFKKATSKKSAKATKLWIKLAGELLGSTAFLSFSSLGKKKNAALRGALLGTVAGVGSVLLNKQDRRKEKAVKLERFASPNQPADPALAKAAQVALYTVAGKVVQAKGKKKKR